MDLKPISPEMDELRNVIISSNLASCYLILELLKSEKSETLLYEEFKNHWIGIYKSTYGIICKMKPRKSSRQGVFRNGEGGGSGDKEKGGVS
jgi:hypothetical protein